MKTKQIKIKPLTLLIWTCLSKLGPSILSELDPSYNRTALGHHPTVTQLLSFLRQRNQFPHFLLMFNIPQRFGSLINTLRHFLAKSCSRCWGVWATSNSLYFFGATTASSQIGHWPTFRYATLSFLPFLYALRTFLYLLMTSSGWCAETDRNLVKYNKHTSSESTQGNTHKCKVVAKRNENYMGTGQLEGPR